MEAVMTSVGLRWAVAVSRLVLKEMTLATTGAQVWGMGHGEGWQWEVKRVQEARKTKDA